MNDSGIPERLFNEGLLSEDSFKKIKIKDQHSLISLFYDLRVLLYAGVLLVSTGLGILVYKNIDTIGHQAVLAFIFCLCAGSFYYCFRSRPHFTSSKLVSPGLLYDYLLLLACLTLLTFIGYWQAIYHIFGDRLALASFIPMIILFLSAYYFDHLGVLSMAIVNLAAWAGISVTPTRFIQENDFYSGRIIYTGFCLGLLLMLAGMATRLRQIKIHFVFTYMHFGIHILFISCLAGLFHFDNNYLLWFLVLIAISFLLYREAIRIKSFYFIFLMTMYAFTGLCYTSGRIMFFNGIQTADILYFAFVFYIAAAVGVIRFLIFMNKKLRVT